MWDSFYSMFRLGMMHIADGADHLLFLCSLIMVAPCEGVNRKWQSNLTWRSTFERTLILVTGFTLGHSISLLLGSLGWVNVQTTWVELLIAVSVAFMGIHSIKPLLLNGELVVTTFFGLIHGLAFASTMQELSESTDVLMIELLGFNLGIEAYQLWVLALMIPLVILASRDPNYRYLRLCIGGFTMLASVIWIWQRTTFQENEATQFLDALPQYKWLMPISFGVAILGFRMNKMISKKK